jgi:serine/threonine protein phosphatase PrpC
MDQKELLVNEKINKDGQHSKTRPQSRKFYVELPLLPVCPVAVDATPWVAETDVEKPFCCAKTISTYPVLANGKRDGDPIADKFLIKTYKNCALLAVADGCSWGIRSLNAATSAVHAFNTYLSKRLHEIRDIHDAGHFMLRAFSEGHNKIIEGKEDIWDAGTTTLIGCMLLELTEDWAILVGNVGDCKAFLYSKEEDQVIEITAGNRLDIVDRRDPGGRLGPYLKGGTPDLRNLHLYLTHCKPGDMIILLSDGVHDNLDPELLGLDPDNIGLGLTAKTWRELNRSVAEEAKDRFRAEFIRKFIKQGHNTPVKLANALLQHCITTTQASRQFMETHPTTPHPENPKEFPGKMDHSTCVVYEVPPKPHPSAIGTPAPNATTTAATAPISQSVASRTPSDFKSESFHKTQPLVASASNNSNNKGVSRNNFMEQPSRERLFETTWTTTTVSSKTIITTTISAPTIVSPSTSTTVATNNNVNTNTNTNINATAPILDRT